MKHEYSIIQNARPLNPQRGDTAEPPQHLDQTQNLCQCWHQTQTNKHSSQSSIS